MVQRHDFKIDELEKDKVTIEAHIEKYLEDQDKSNDRLYSEIHKLRSELVTSLAQVINKITNSEKEANDKFITKNQAALVWGAVSITVLACVWFFTNVSINSVSDKHAAQIQEMTKTIVEQIQK